MTPRNALRTIVIAAAAGAAGIAGAASAEPFNGPYVGAQIGWQQDKANASWVLPVDDGTGVVTQTRFNDSRNKSAFAGGIFAGYNAKVNPTIVLGGEVGLDFGGKDMAVGPVAGVKAKNTWSALAKAGALVTPQTLLYVKGGYENARFDFRNGAYTIGSSRDGWSIGGGGEYAFTDNVMARLEYRYSEFGDPSDSWRAIGYTPVDDGKLKRHQVMVGLSYQF
jgi:outer membrane immunogenic protein